MSKYIFFANIFLLCACVQYSPLQINNDNAFEHMKVTRGSSVYGNKFFKSSLNKPLGNCLTNNSACTKQQLTLGTPIDAQYYEVSLSGVDFIVSYPMDKLLIAAAMVAIQEGYRFIIPLTESTSSAFSQQPTYYTDCISYTNGGYCSSYGGHNISSYTGYRLGFFAFNSYDDIKNGVLIHNGYSDVGTVFYPLYETKESLDAVGFEPIVTSQINSYSTMTMERKPYSNAWKTKYVAQEILQGEQVEVKQFEIKDEQINSHTSIKEKYKR